ncbi:hypothetical protein [Streptomyces stelliscabiei]|uniref:hypothetical protein n=1 Tax=Streptomyces stelliscabiei TaxID=146820 RepID=UPI003A944F69
MLQPRRQLVGLVVGQEIGAPGAGAAGGGAPGAVLAAVPAGLVVGAQRPADTVVGAALGGVVPRDERGPGTRAGRSAGRVGRPRARRDPVAPDPVTPRVRARCLARAAFPDAVALVMSSVIVLNSPSRGAW